MHGRLRTRRKAGRVHPLASPGGSPKSRNSERRMLVSPCVHAFVRVRAGARTCVYCLCARDRVVLSWVRVAI